jgi:hypothetical protein
MVAIAAAGHARADYVIGTPPGLSPGEQFRIVFVTDATTAATSSNINYYNSFVNTDATNEAGGGNVTYNGTILTFTVIASTETTSAISNIGTTGAPVYLSDGTEIASSDTNKAGGLWGGKLLHTINSDLKTTMTPYEQTWTGTATDGTTFTGVGLGDERVAIGDPYQINQWWLITGDYGYAGHPLAVYGISQVLTVPGVASVPEPSTLVLGTIGAACVFIYALGRNRRTQQR